MFWDLRCSAGLSETMWLGNKYTHATMTLIELYW